jgi:hypothetical protein
MNRALLSLCLFGAALATANILIMQRPTCRSGGTEVAAADKNALSTKTEVVSTAKAKPAKAPFQAQPPQASKTAAKPPAPPKDVDVTGSVKQTTKTDQKQSARAESKIAADPNLAAPVQPGPHVRPYRPSKNGWRRHYRYPRPPVGFAIRVYPRW